MTLKTGFSWHFNTTLNSEEPWCEMQGEHPGREQGCGAQHGRRVRQGTTLSDTMCLSISFRKSTFPQNRQLNMLISSQKNVGRRFCGGVESLKLIDKYIMCDDAKTRGSVFSLHRLLLRQWIASIPGGEMTWGKLFGGKWLKRNTGPRLSLVHSRP